MLVKQDQYVEKSYVYVEFHIYVQITIYMSKLQYIYDTAFGYISIDILDIYITIWIQILQFGYIYCNLDKYIVIWT